jgi:hypothetical protein
VVKFENWIFIGLVVWDIRQFLREIVFLKEIFSFLKCLHKCELCQSEARAVIDMSIFSRGRQEMSHLFSAFSGLYRRLILGVRHRSLDLQLIALFVSSGKEPFARL